MAVEAESYFYCMTANAVKVLKSPPQYEVYMVPDMNLARYAAARTDQRIPYVLVHISSGDMERI